MICVHCSKPTNPDARYCHNCGKEVEQVVKETVCPICDGAVAADAKFCPHCGTDQSLHLPIIAETEHHPTLDLACRKCRSTNVKRLPIAYSEGLSNVNLKHAGAGIGIGSGGVGIALGSADTKGTNQTLLSAKLAPPKIGNVGGLVVTALGLFTIAFCFISFSIMMATVLGLSGVTLGIIALFTSNANETARRDTVKWENSFVCLRCGDIFVEDKQYSIELTNYERRCGQEAGDEVFRERVG